MKSSLFGAAKPLKGQPGYNVSETDMLEKEAKDMEIRLKNLQERMSMQKLEDDSLAKPGGARWKSAREDRGSVRNYAKDVQERQQRSLKKKGSMDLLTGQFIKNKNNTINDDSNKYAESDTKYGNSPSYEDKYSADYHSTVPENWNEEHVSDWLNSMNLAQYSAIFNKNEITGKILLDLSLDDFDYMNITVLGHRKMLMKSIEELRTLSVNKQPYSAGNIAQGKSTLTSKSLDGLPKIPDTVNSPTVKASNPPYQMHWSHLEPLSTNIVTNEPMQPNAADDGIRSYANAELDEEAEKQAFSDAVLAWRNAGKVTTSKTLAGSTGTGTSTSPKDSAFPSHTSVSSSFTNNNDGNGGWKDPFSVPQMDDEDDNDLFQDPASTNTTGNTRKKTKIIKQNTQKSDGSTSTITTSIITTQGNSTRVIREPMSEEAERLEREEFQKAVMEWRKDTGRGVVTATSNSNSNNNTSAASSSSGANNTNAAHTDSSIGNNDSIHKKSLATEKLMMDMDRKYELQAQALEQQKRQAQEQLDKAAKDLEESRKNFKSWTSNDSEWRADSKMNDDDDDYDMVSSPASNSEYEKDDNEEGDGDYKGVRSKYSANSTPNSKVNGHANNNKYDVKESPVSVPTVQLIESIKLSEYKEDQQESGAYYVEEADDDEDV